MTPRPDPLTLPPTFSEATAGLHRDLMRLYPPRTAEGFTLHFAPHGLLFSAAAALQTPEQFPADLRTLYAADLERALRGEFQAGRPMPRDPELGHAALVAVAEFAVDLTPVDAVVARERTFNIVCGLLDVYNDGAPVGGGSFSGVEAIARHLGLIA